LDNRAEVIHLLHKVLDMNSPDLAVVAAAYEEWNVNCFAKLIGDWALSIWDANTRSLILAKDPIGARHLYFSLDKDQVTWSTILDPLILFAGKALSLCEEYIAGWFSFFPAVHLTPYVGIHSVPPSSLVLIRAERHTVSKYWDFDPSKRIRYTTDAEYEEHFRTVFAKAVQRRLRSDSPILAELSGGMDSSSIVCMADTIIACGGTDTPRLDTLSCYDDSEPNWNERPYFTKVEKKRARTGCHINVSSLEPFHFEPKSSKFAATPNSGGRGPSEVSRQVAALMTAQENRVVLSGIGGDEVLGGVPTPIPELMDLFARGRFQALAYQLKAWALNKRKPWLHLFLEAARGFFPPALAGVPGHMQPAPWLTRDFVKRHRVTLTGYPSRVRVSGPPPSFQECLSTLEGLRRQLHCNVLPLDPPHEKRYPYLDRDLLEFVYAVPREQLVRPGQRRSLMRRALVGIVPDELLNRRRKAFVARSPIAAISAEWASLSEISQHMITSSLGIIDSSRLCEALQKARHGEECRIVTLMRTFGIEFWLRGLINQEAFIDWSRVIITHDSALLGQPKPLRAVSREEFS
jgi:asparagine synthase (glutamine-hydrolysing)